MSTINNSQHINGSIKKIFLCSAIAITPFFSNSTSRDRKKKKESHLVGLLELLHHHLSLVLWAENVCSLFLSPSEKFCHQHKTPQEEHFLRSEESNGFLTAYAPLTTTRYALRSWAGWLRGHSQSGRALVPPLPCQPPRLLGCAPPTCLGPPGSPASQPERQRRSNLRFFFRLQFLYCALSLKKYMYYQ